jgi:hypothetical protein
MYIGIGTIVVIVIIVLVILMLRRRLCSAAAPARIICRMSKAPWWPRLYQTILGTQNTVRPRFSLGGPGREVTKSVAVERLRLRAGPAKSRQMRPGSACLCRYRRSIPGGTRHDQS